MDINKIIGQACNENGLVPHFLEELIQGLGTNSKRYVPILIRAFGILEEDHQKEVLKLEKTIAYLTGQQNKEWKHPRDLQ